MSVGRCSSPVSLLLLRNCKVHDFSDEADNPDYRRATIRGAQNSGGSGAANALFPNQRTGPARLAARRRGPRRKLRPLPAWNMDEFKVDVADRDALYKAMEGY